MSKVATYQSRGGWGSFSCRKAKAQVTYPRWREKFLKGKAEKRDFKGKVWGNPRLLLR